jgi:glucose-6-phosphate isomerase
MTAIETIELTVITADVSGAGTDGDVYLGFGGREFYAEAVYGHPVHPESISFRMGLNLLIALVAGSMAKDLVDQRAQVAASLRQLARIDVLRRHLVSTLAHDVRGPLTTIRGAVRTLLARKGLDPETTLFIVASKTFTTIETMTNAETARKWIEQALGAAAVAKHFAAVSTALDKVEKFGIAPDRVFGFWDWVGGRYSLWSAIGLPVMIAVGAKHFREFLAGAHEMDSHFATAPLLKNIPVVMGLIGYWHRVVCSYPTRAVIPYDQRLSRLPAYLQQLDMESNGKRVTIDGGAASTPTGPVVWGEPGTNGQHAFFQLLHQGTDVIPVEFLAAAQGHEPELRHHHDLLLANCLAQSEALMKGRTLEEAQAQMSAKGMTPDEIEKIAPHRVFPGNRPSVTILYKKLDPHTLGRLIALYEHRVFVEAQLFGINAFDQWGVELGKELATGLLPVVEGTQDAARSDASTAGLVRYIHHLRGAE